MKVRSGFVSNSSTSSFIVVGMKFESQPTIEQMKTWIDADMKLQNKFSHLSNDGAYEDYFYDNYFVDHESTSPLVGLSLVYWSDEYEEVEVDITKIEAYRKRLSTILDEPVSKIKLYATTIAS